MRGSDPPSSPSIPTIVIVVPGGANRPVPLLFLPDLRDDPLQDLGREQGLDDDRVAARHQPDLALVAGVVGDDLPPDDAVGGGGGTHDDLLPFLNLAQAFLRLIAQDRLKVAPHLTEWLYTVCRNQAIDVRRKQRRMEFLNDADADSATSSAPDPGARAEIDDSMSHVLRSLRQLPRNQQECIRLKFQGGLSYKQISDVTNLTVTNVGFLIHRGIKSIREMLS